MAKFVFTLQPLLDTRVREEQRRQREVAVVERERRAVEDRIRAQQSIIAQSRRDMADRLTGSVDVTHVRSEGASTLRAIRAAQRLVLELAGVHKRLERARRELLEATKRRRAVELLRDNRFNEWKQRTDKAEANAMDELAVQRAGRKEAMS
jgi:flagellar FliJ protein